MAHVVRVRAVETAGDISLVCDADWRATYEGTQLLGGDSTFTLAASGHIAGVVNPPASKKYQYWTGGKPVGEFETWMKSAEEHPGSWWPHWHAWLREQNGEEVAARKVGSRKHKPLEDAPGSFVMVKA